MIASLAVLEAERIVRRRQTRRALPPCASHADALVHLEFAESLMLSQWPEVRGVGRLMLLRAMEALR